MSDMHLKSINNEINLIQMKIKKSLFTLLIVFALSFSFQPVNFFKKEKESVVYVIETSIEKHSDEFLKRNENKKLCIAVSLTLQCFMIYKSNYCFNTS